MWCLGSPSSPLPVWVSVNHCLWYNRSRFFRNLVAYFPASACAAKSLRLCLTLCDPIDGSPHQAPQSLGFPRQEYWSGLPFPSPMHACMLSHFSCVQLCATLWTAAHQASLCERGWGPAGDQHEGQRRGRWRGRLECSGSGSVRTESCNQCMSLVC